MVGYVLRCKCGLPLRKIAAAFSIFCLTGVLTCLGRGGRFLWGRLAEDGQVDALLLVKVHLLVPTYMLVLFLSLAFWFVVGCGHFAFSLLLHDAKFYCLL